MALCDVIVHRVMPFEEVRERRHELTLLRDVFGDAHMMPMSSYTDLAEKHRLVIEQATDLTAATHPTFDRWRANANEHRDEVIRRFGDVGEDDWRRFIDACNVLESLWDEGTFGYGLVAASKP
jgi:27-O-demethylrifamycin SV methyltransferase